MQLFSYGASLERFIFLTQSAGARDKREAKGLWENNLSISKFIYTQSLEGGVFKTSSTWVMKKI